MRRPDERLPLNTILFFMKAKLYWPMAFLYSARINEALLSFTPSIPPINTVNTICSPAVSLQRNSVFFLY